MINELEWIPPKTDWKVSYDAEGHYTGDYLEPADYNRMKNNLCCLKELAERLNREVEGFQDMGRDVVYGDSMEPFASSFRVLQDNLDAVNRHSMKLHLGEPERFAPDTASCLKEELNRIESAELRIYEMLTGQRNNKPRLQMILGRKGVRVS